jgi:hypothetical protein
VTISISGLVLDAYTEAPITSGATVEVMGTSVSTTSGVDGSWTLQIVPGTEDPFLRITATGPENDVGWFGLKLVYTSSERKPDMSR